MNLGDNRWHSKYICDKCRKVIPYIGQKGFVGINHYYKSTKNHTPSKSFDLCESCEQKLREWLNTIEIPTTKNLLDRFERYEEEK